MNILENIPFRWCLLRVSPDLVKVMGFWVGGYLYGDSWKLNSGIESVIDGEDAWTFVGFSGSRYVCRKDGYGTTAYGWLVLRSIDVEPMDVNEAEEWIHSQLL
jgi:hypothetical protein